MASKFVPFENALVQINDQNIFAENATLGVQVDLTPVESIDGEVLRYASSSPVKGTFSFTHYMTGSLPSFLNPTNELSEPLSGSFAGIVFASGYIKSMSFSVEPFSPVAINSQIDIYGELSQLEDVGHSNKNINLQTGLAHGQYSYLAGSDLGYSNTTSFSYSVTCSRNPVTVIGQELPYRVTKEDIIVNMSVKGEDLGNVLKPTGNNAVINVKLFDVYETSKPLDTFSCTGQITNQNISAGNGGTLAGSMSISQTHLTGKSII